MKHKQIKLMIPFGTLFLTFVVTVLYIRTQVHPKFEYVTSYNDDGATYQCSKLIKVRRMKYPKGGEGPSSGYQAVDSGDSTRYCEITGVF